MLYDVALSVYKRSELFRQYVAKIHRIQAEHSMLGMESNEQAMSCQHDFPGLQVSVRTTLKHTNEITFPAVTVCNMNPIKSSLLSNNARLEALVASWGVGNRRRRRRDISDASASDSDVMIARSRQRRDVTAPSVTGKFCACQPWREQLVFMLKNYKTYSRE